MNDADIRWAKGKLDAIVLDPGLLDYLEAQRQESEHFEVLTRSRLSHLNGETQEPKAPNFDKERKAHRGKKEDPRDGGGVPAA